MKTFIVLCLVAIAVAEQRSSKTFRLGSAAPVDYTVNNEPGPAPAQNYRPRPVYKPQPIYNKPQPEYKPQPAYKPQPSYKAQPAYKEPTYPDVPANYEWAYDVQDDYASVDFNANEARNDYKTNGQYRVALPDGRIQTVTYTVEDAYSGFVADVQYEGEASYEEPKPSYAPAYVPAPVYGN